MTNSDPAGRSDLALAWAFFKRDALIALSYRTAFVMQIAGSFLWLGMFYFIGRTVGGQDLPTLDRYGGNYFAFLLVGIALTDCVGVSLTTFATQIRESQMTGALEATLMSPVGLRRILIYSSLWSYFLSACRFLLYLLFGVAVFGVGLEQANLTSALVIFLLTVLSFAGVGMLWASVVMLIKRGEAITAVLSYLVLLVSGVVFPVAVLPAWLQTIAQWVPLTHALEGMRFALLKGADLRALAPVIGTLCAFSVALIAGGMYAFKLAVDVAKRSGSLTEF